MAAGATAREQSGPLILERIAEARRRARFLYRGQFAATWLVLVGGLGLFLWASGQINPEFIAKWGPFILDGARTTILVCVVSITFATMLAILGAMGRLSRHPVINGAASLYVSLVRGTPLLVQIYFAYLALAEVGIVLPVLVAGIGALAFNYGAYMTEIFRAGIQAVPSGQREAAEALGMAQGLITRRIVMPQAIRIVIPAIGNDFVAMIKDSSLVSVIAVQELLWRAQSAGRRNIAILEALLIAALIYWLLTIIFSFFQERLERRMARGDR
ncbi:MAG: amino acid ABC transporter permease [Chloroflexi bacterium]|nr:amino acid ABC transporter permease [Chloroflexota bacterium]